MHKVVTGRSDKHEIDRDIPLLRKLLDKPGPKNVFKHHKFNINPWICLA